jgi:hypothetical protein
MTAYPHSADASDFGHEPPPPASRTSLLAVFSLVFGVIGLLICCIPGPGIIAVILGVGALLAISTSQMRLTGRGLAISGLILGLISSVISLGIWVGVTIAFGQLGPYPEVLEHIQAGDRQAVSDMLSSSSDAALTDQRMAEFMDAVQEKWGPFERPAEGLGEILRGYYDSAPQNIQNRFRSDYPDERPFLIPARFRDGLAVVCIVLDRRETTPAGRATIRNIGVGTRDGRIIWLLDPAAPPAPPPSPAPGPDDPQEDPHEDPPGGEG